MHRLGGGEGLDDVAVVGCAEEAAAALGRRGVEAHRTLPAPKRPLPPRLEAPPATPSRAPRMHERAPVDGSRATQPSARSARFLTFSSSSRISTISPSAHFLTRPVPTPLPVPLGNPSRGGPGPAGAPPGPSLRQVPSSTTVHVEVVGPRPQHHTPPSAPHPPTHPALSTTPRPHIPLYTPK